MKKQHLFFLILLQLSFLILSGCKKESEETTPPGGNTATDTGYIFFTSTRDGNYEIFSCRMDGSNIVRLTDNPAYDDCPKVNPSHTLIAFNSTRSGQKRLYVMNLDGSNQQLVSNRWTEGYAGWTRDGKIIYGDGGGAGLYKIDPDGTNEIKIATPLSGKHFTEVSCSPVSDRLTTTLNGSWGYDRTIYLMNTDGSGQTVLVPDTPGITINGGFRPNGTGICYAHDLTGHEEISGESLDDHIFIMNIDGTGATDISTQKPANTNDLFPIFTPSGTKILFWNKAIGSGGAFDTWIMKTDGTGRTRIITNGMVYDCIN